MGCGCGKGGVKRPAQRTVTSAAPSSSTNSMQQSPQVYQSATRKVPTGPQPLRRPV